MKFDDLDARMRVFETVHDQCVLPGIFMVARLDGRSFTKLTKETLNNADLEFHRSEYERLRATLVDEQARSSLPETPSARPDLNRLLVRVRFQHLRRDGAV